MRLQRMSRSLTNHLRAANDSSKPARVSECATSLTVSVLMGRFANGFFKGGRQVLDEGLDQHPGRIGGDHNDPLSSPRQPIPFGVVPVEYPILLQRTEIGNCSRIGFRNVGGTRAIIR